MLEVAIVGASGYTGAELVRLISRHPDAHLHSLHVSEHSADAGRSIAALYPGLTSISDLKLNPLSLTDLSCLDGVDAAFLCTDHKVSHDLAPLLIAKGITVFDLSGAFRLSDPAVFEKFYGFAHQHMDLQRESLYALCEFCSADEMKNTTMFSMPGCYPTAAQLAIRPLLEHNLTDPAYRININAVSGVSGSGRKAKLSSSFCEVSLNAYGVFKHRHLPEIEEHLKSRLIFTPHLGDFKRGILETITLKVKSGVTQADIAAAYAACYAGKPLVRVLETMPRLMDVQETPFCDISFVLDEDGYVIIGSAIDNLLKGASSQALQAFNLHYGFAETMGML